MQQPSLVKKRKKESSATIESCKNKKGRKKNQMQQPSLAKGTMELSAWYHRLAKANIVIRERFI